MSGPARAGLSGGAATWALARLAMVRAVRGKAIWLALALALLPIVVAGVRVGLGHDRAEVWETVVGLTLLILPVVPSILVASSLADEFEDRTSAYLWSRALPRWTIVVGKVVGLGPFAAAIMVVGAGGGWLVAGGPGSVPASLAVPGLAGLAGAALAASCLTAAIATIVPRHAVAVAVVWLLVIDAPVGALPFKLRFVSISFAAKAVAGFDDAGRLAGAVTLAVIAALGTALAVWRVGRME